MVFRTNRWCALILGGSSGIGLASAKKLAAWGMDIVIVHRDRRGEMPRIETEFAAIRALGVELRTFNVDALSEEGIARVVDGLKDFMNDRRIRVMLHSIAWGNLKPMAPELDVADADQRPLLDREDFAHTVHAMGTSLVGWVQSIYQQGWFTQGARIIGLTSEGNSLAFKGYTAVSAAKGALEACLRGVAKEYGPLGLRGLILQPGVTDTPALRAIPGHQRMVDGALARNPLGRLTRPEDVAGVVALLAMEEASWINGALIRIDGGEHIGG